VEGYHGVGRIRLYLILSAILSSDFICLYGVDMLLVKSMCTELTVNEEDVDEVKVA
jgi:hypothetical protein